MRGRVISQAKDLKTLSKASVKSSIAKFKEQYLGLKDSDDSPLIGFELNGGNRMTKEGQEIWNEFEEWCDERNLQCEYNTNADLEIMLEILYDRVHVQKIIAT